MTAGSGPTVATPTQAAITGTNAEVWAECNGLAGAGVTARTAESVAPGIGGVVAGTNAASDGTVSPGRAGGTGATAAVTVTGAVLIESPSAAASELGVGARYKS